MKIAITGASGFIGRGLSNSLRGKSYEVVKVVRLKKKDDTEKIAIGEINSTTDWSKALDGVDCIIHCAGLAHVLNATNKNQLLSNYDEINALGTLNLAKQAADKGVSRIIFLSSVGFGFPGIPMISSTRGLFSKIGLLKLKVTTDKRTPGIKVLIFFITGVPNTASPNPLSLIIKIFLILSKLFSICLPLRIYFS